MLDFQIIICIAAGAVVASALLSACSYPLLGILQQSGYSGKAFVKWYCRKGNMLPRRYSLLTLSLVLLVALFALCFSFLGAVYSNLISAIPYIGLCTVFCYAFRGALKVPLKKTGRVIRLSVCYFILLVLVHFGLGVAVAASAEAIGHDLVFVFRFVPLSLLPLVLVFLLCTANFIMKAYETPRNNRFIRKAAETLKNSRCIKVGVTGSYAKTSVKNMTAEILSVKYSVVATPASFNTPVGIARTVNEKGCDCDVFLAEMGARKRGDIRELCDMVRPEYGVVTGVCPQHLETFGSEEAVRAEKGVLASYVKKAVLGSSAAGMSASDAWTEGKDFAAENIVCTERGTSFTLRLNGDTLSVNTPLLGRHAAQDIALSAALCCRLGMTVSEIGEGISRIRPVPHRLQHIERNGLHILDDSYNSNVEGARDAVETLRLFGGKKYVVTPGLVELGAIEEEENAKLGASLVGLDGVLLVGETLVLAVRRGYLAAGGAEDKLRVVPTLSAASEILAKELNGGDSVLFLNDLPDIYN